MLQFFISSLDMVSFLLQIDQVMMFLILNFEKYVNLGKKDFKEMCKNDLNNVVWQKKIQMLEFRTTFRIVKI